MTLLLTVTQARLTSIVFSTLSNHYTVSISYDLISIDIKGNTTIIMSKILSNTYLNTVPVTELATKAAQIKADVLAYWGTSVDTVLIGGQSY